MRKKYIVLGALVLGAAHLSSVHASDGTISFTGKITGVTCTVAVGGVGGGSPATVRLPAVSTKALAAAGDVAGRTNFSITLSGCAAGAGRKAAAFFESGVGVNPSSGTLINTAGGAAAATNVELQLMDVGNNSAIKVGDSAQLTSAELHDIVASGDVTLPYAVQYLSTGTVTEGDLTGSVTFSINYQ